MSQKPYQPNYNLSLEELLLDYFKYKESLDSQEVKREFDDHEIGKGWPVYKDMDLYEGFKEWDKYPDHISKDEQIDVPYGNYYMPFRDKNDGKHKKDCGCMPNKKTKFHEPMWQQKKNLGGIHDEWTEIESMKQLQCNIVKKLEPYVFEVLNEYEYDGSPIYANLLERESIDQIIGKVMKRIKSEIRECTTINPEKETEHWSKHALLQSLIGVMVLRDIYHIRRPIWFGKAIY